MSTPPLFLKHGLRGKRGYAQVYLNGVCVGAASAHKSNKCPDPEKLATLVSIKRALGFASKYGVILPPPLRAVLGLAHQLLELRYKAALDPGNPGKLKKAQAVLEAAKRNPSRIVRAGAAALQELLQ